MSRDSRREAQAELRRRIGECALKNIGDITGKGLCERFRVTQHTVASALADVGLECGTRGIVQAKAAVR